MSKKQELTLDIITSEDKQYDEMKKVSLSKDYYTYINKKFRPSTIDDLLVDFSNTLSELEKAGHNVKEDEVMNFLMLHIMKFFSTFGKEIPNTPTEKYFIFNKLLDSPYVKKIAEAFDKKEITKVWDRMIEKFEEYVELLKMNKQAKDEFIKKIDSMKLENKELIKEVFLQDSGLMQ